MKRVIILAVLILLISSSYSFAEVPCKINYQGRLIKDNVPVNAPVDMEFRLYTVETGGSPIKTISTNNVPVYNGLFRVVLDLEGVDWTAGQELYLEVKAGDETLSPREPIYAYPYAINTHLLEGKTTTHFLDVSSSTQTKQGGLNILGNVGIGTTSPGEKLDVSGNLNVTGNFSFNNGTKILAAKIRWPIPHCSYLDVPFPAGYFSTDDIIVTVTAIDDGTGYNADFFVSNITSSGFRLWNRCDEITYTSWPTAGILVKHHDWAAGVNYLAIGR